MLKLTDNELHRMADLVRRATRHGQLTFWVEVPEGFRKLTLPEPNVDYVAEGANPAHIEVVLT